MLGSEEERRDPSPYVTYRDLLQFREDLLNKIDERFSDLDRKTVSFRQWAFTQFVSIAAVVAAVLSIHFH